MMSTVQTTIQSPRECVWAAIFLCYLAAPVAGLPQGSPQALTGETREEYLGRLPDIHSDVALEAIVAAVDSGDAEKLEQAISEAGCRPDCGTIFDALQILHRAARTGSAPMVASLLTAGATINQQPPPLEWTPLMEALGAANVDVARYLVEAGADVGLTGADGTTPPFLAEIVGLGDLIPYPRITLSQADADALLLRAIEADNMEVLKFAIEAGANPGATAPNGWSALMIGAFNGHVEIMRALLALDSDIYLYFTADGFDALRAALIGPQPTKDPRLLNEILSILLDLGAQPTMSVDNGPTALDIARDRSLPSEVVANLEEKRGDVRAYVLQNTNLRRRPEASGTPIAVLKPTDGVWVLGEYDPDEFVLVEYFSFDTGTVRGYILGRLLFFGTVEEVVDALRADN